MGFLGISPCSVTLLGIHGAEEGEILGSLRLLQLTYKKFNKVKFFFLSPLGLKTRWESTSRAQSIGLGKKVLWILGGKGRNADFCCTTRTFWGRGIPRNAITLPKPFGCNGQVGLLQV